MRRSITLAVLLLCLLASLAISASAKDSDSQTRLLIGQVTNSTDAPLPEAVVYLKNTKTLTTKTFITDASGNYRFPELSPNVDYEIYAEHKGTKSPTKTLSSFDSRPKATINLKVGK